MTQLPANYRDAVAAKMVDGEEVLWIGRPIPKHAWTVIGTTFPRGRIGRAISLVVFEILSFWTLAIGLVFAAFVVTAFFEFDWALPKTIAMLLATPVAVVVIGGGIQLIMMPKQIYEWAHVARYVLTTHHAFIVFFNGEKDVVQETCDIRNQVGRYSLG